MTSIENYKNLNRSLKAYNWYVIFTRAYFWTPIFVLYFSTVVTLKQIFLLEALYYASVFVLEVPSGYFSDFFGRKKTLVISTLCLSGSYLLFFIGGSFGIFAVAQVFLAVGFSFSTGTDTSLHYALLHALDRESEYGTREAKLGSRMYISIGAAAILGGLFAWLNEYRIAYGLSFIFALVSFALVLMMKDPENEEKKDSQALHPFKQMKRVFAKLVDPMLKYLFVFTVIMTVLNHIPYELYQVYVKDMLASFNNETLLGADAIILGIHTAISMMIAAFFAKRSIGIQKAAGTKITLLLMVVIQTILIAFMGIKGSYVIVILLLLRGLPNAVSNPIIRSETTHKLEADLRATYYSTKSLLGRISFALVLFSFHLAPGDGFNNALMIGSSVGLVFLLILAILPIKKP